MRYSDEVIGPRVVELAGEPRQIGHVGRYVLAAVGVVENKFVTLINEGVVERTEEAFEGAIAIAYYIVVAYYREIGDAEALEFIVYPLQFLQQAKIRNISGQQYEVGSLLAIHAFYKGRQLVVEALRVANENKTHGIVCRLLVQTL